MERQFGIASLKYNSYIMTTKQKHNYWTIIVPQFYTKFIRTPPDTANKWEIMLFNIQKCKFIRITLKNKPIPYHYTLYDMILQEVTQTKYCT